MWEDPFLAHISPQYAHLDLETHYSELAKNLAQAIELKDEFPQNARLKMAYHVALVLSLKCHLHSRLALAYQHGRRQELYDLTQGRLKDLQEAVDQLWKYHRSMWHKSNKPFGWEVVELRYGGLRTRLTTMRDRILEYIECFERWQQLQQQQQQLQLQESTSGLLATSNGAASSYSSNGNGFGGRYRRGSFMNDEDERPTIPEFEVNREAMYEYAGCNLLMDYARVSTPSRPG